MKICTHYCADNHIFKIFFKVSHKELQSLLHSWNKFYHFLDLRSAIIADQMQKTGGEPIFSCKKLLAGLGGARLPLGCRIPSLAIWSFLHLFQKFRWYAPAVEKEDTRWRQRKKKYS